MSGYTSYYQQTTHQQRQRGKKDTSCISEKASVASLAILVANKKDHCCILLRTFIW